jgi:uncharacterized protein (DUF1800 family)
MPEVQRLAKVFRDNDYEIGSLLQAMFLSEHFWVVENRGTLIKSPVDLIVGSIRNLNIQIHDTGPLSRISRRLGQDLFDPPNVKGWVGGTDWITSDSLLARQAFLHQLLRSSDQAITTTNDTMSAEINKKPDNRIKRKNKNKMQMAVNMPEDIIAIITDNDRSSKKLQQVLLPLNPVNSIDEYAADNELLKQYLVDPAYQLR